MIMQQHSSRWVFFCVWLLSLSILGWCSTVGAQSPDSEWSAPADVAYPVTEGRDLWGVLLCDPYQNMHMLWSKGDQSSSEIYYKNDVEGEWSAPLDVIAMPYPTALRLSAALSQPDNVLHLIWQDHWVRGDVYYSRVPLANAADPRSWSTPELIVANADSASILSGTDGTMYIPYSVSSADGYWNAAYLLKSQDGGATWSDPVTVFETSPAMPSSISVRMAQDGRGRFHCGVTIRSQEYGVYSELDYLRSLDGGQTWQPYVVIASQSEETPNVAVLAPFVFGEDEVHLTWHDPRRMHKWSSDGGETWSTPVEMIRLGAGFGGANVLAKDSTGTLRAVVGSKSNIIALTWDGLQWITPEQIEDRNMDPHGQRLVVCQGNQLHVVYDDRMGDETTVWYSHREVDAPHFERQPIPQADSQKTTVDAREGASITTPTVQTDTSPASTPTPLSLEASRIGVTSDPVGPLLLPTVVVLCLIGSVIAWRWLQRGRF